MSRPSEFFLQFCNIGVAYCNIELFSDAVAADKSAVIGKRKEIKLCQSYRGTCFFVLDHSEMQTDEGNFDHYQYKKKTEK